MIQRIHGHAQVTTTRIYTEPSDPLTREAAGLIGKALWSEASLAGSELEASRVQPQLQRQAGG